MIASLSAWSELPGVKAVSLIAKFGLLWPAVIGYVVFIEKRNPESVGLNHSTIGTIAGGIFIVASTVIAGFNGLALALARLVQAGAEELVYRGWLLNRAGERLGPIAAILASTGAFMLFHALNPGMTPGAIRFMLVFSVISAVYVQQTGEIITPTVLHAISNWRLDLWG